MSFNLNKSKTLMKLPECGMFVGSGIYPSSADYLLSTLHGHMAWQPQTNHPLEMIDKIVGDNQGNLAQFWGQPRGTAPAVVAEWIYALDEIGIEVPSPDWKNGKYLQLSKCQEIKDHPERLGAGILRFAKAAAEKGIYTTCLYTNAHPQCSKQLKDLGDWYLGYDFGERFTFRFETVNNSEKDRAKATLRELTDNFIASVREHVDERRAAGWGNVMATSCNFYIDYEILGGAEIPVLEDFAFSHINFASALSRGLFRQHDLPMWGSHLAHEHYSWIPNGSEYKFFLLKAAMYQKYMSGSKMIINESGNWFVEGTLCEDSPKHTFPRVPLNSSQVSWNGEKGPMTFAPYIEEARGHYHKINYGSDICRRYRKEISDFYDFVKANGTPEGQPESTVSVAKGNYDLCNHRFSPNNPIAGAYDMADANPSWLEGAPERGWETVKQVFYPLLPTIGEYHNSFLSGSPFGMVDIVSFANDEIDADFLNANYKALLFSGWNTSSTRQYETLKKFVGNGGTLFISIPHLSTNVTRNYADYGVEELVNGGDFSDLCGVKVKGRGKRFYWATAPHGSEELGFKFPRRFGIMQTCMGDIEVTDKSAETLLVDDEQAAPLLLRRNFGKGKVYFLNSWAYPGAMDQDFGPGGRRDSPGLIGMIYRHIAAENRGSVWITDDQIKTGKECEYITFSYFPEAGKIYLYNIDLKKSHGAYLHYSGKTERFDLEPGEFRVLGK
jgi:hypothetical protein